MEKVSTMKAKREDLKKVIEENFLPAYLARLNDPDSVMVSYFIKDELVAVGGIFIARLLGFGEFWLAPLPGFFTHPRAPLAVKESMEKWEKHLNLNRFQLSIKTNNSKLVRWAEWLGFEREGTLRSYMNGEDVYMYSKVRT